MYHKWNRDRRASECRAESEKKGQILRSRTSTIHQHKNKSEPKTLSLSTYEYRAIHTETIKSKVLRQMLAQNICIFDSNSQWFFSSILQHQVVIVCVFSAHFAWVRFVAGLLKCFQILLSLLCGQHLSARCYVISIRHFFLCLFIVRVIIDLIFQLPKIGLFIEF